MHCMQQYQHCSTKCCFVFSISDLNSMSRVSVYVYNVYGCDMHLPVAVHFVDIELTEKPLIQSGCGRFHVCAVDCACFFYCVFLLNASLFVH